ncbi:putative anthranilate synthase [Helianthus debilis subsp. tardiflorus]
MKCAVHIMLVDLGRNDVGKVTKPGSVNVEKLMVVERYSHVMHISSTVTGELLDNLTCWDALSTDFQLELLVVLQIFALHIISFYILQYKRVG